MKNFLVCVALLAAVPNLANGVAPASFGDAYTVRGTLYIPYAELREPFTGWFDLGQGTSRIDYYGNMVKTYQLAKQGAYGTSLKVAPFTTEEVQNQNTCFQVDGSAGSPILPQSILPDLTDFKSAGQEMLNGVVCDKWRREDVIGEKSNKYTMWTRSKKPEVDVSVSDGAVIPVRYEMKGYNTLLGSHYDHYYLDYEWFSDQPPSPVVFVLEKNVTCQGFPGPGDKHVYTFNPMKEFIHNYQGHTEAAFDEFKEKHRKVYEDHKDQAQRFEHFRQNLRLIHSHNRAGLSFTLGVNHLADRSDLELKALRGKAYSSGSHHNGAQPFPYTQQQVNRIIADIPETVDWRIAGAVTPVKDQSVCGSCWSFGTTGTVEGAYFLKYGKQKVLSQQALIDCSWGFGNNGCDGGEDFRSYQWIIKHGGLPTFDAYGPYLGQDGYCHIDDTMDRVKITSYVNVTSGDVNAMKTAIALHGPISVAIDASKKTFSFYSSGVYYDAECGNTLEELDHAVLAVGYGKLNGKDYWLVKNSWSSYWGNIGFILMSTEDNNCGVTTDATYVNVA